MADESHEICAWHYHLRRPVRARWQNGLITSIQTVADQPPSNTWIAPCLVDLQINGYAGIDFQQDNLTLDDLVAATRALRADGCSRWFLTLITDEWPRLMARLRHLHNLRQNHPELQQNIAGWHLEGPFLSSEPGFAGAHPTAFMCDPTSDHIHQLRQATQPDPVLLTLAPERPGAIDAIHLATSLGIKISLGHTNASSAQLRQAVAHGACAFTHLGNGCPLDLNRHDNIVWRVLDTPGLTTSFIVDQIHVSPALLRLAHRALKPDRLYYTSDAMAAAAAPPGRYHLGALEVQVGPDQIVRKPNSQHFAGSALRPIDGIRRATRMLDRPWQELWPHYSSVPARLVGLDCDLAAGQPACFCLIEISAENRIQRLQPAP